jgi:pimeloyl-ACP methyl ester carboxylesterase
MSNASSFFRRLILLCLLIAGGDAIAQESWIAYFQKVDITKFTGHRFRVHAFVRTERENDSASARLWVRIDTKGGMGFFENMDANPIRNSRWKKYNIEGLIDSTGQQLSFGAICLYNGKFYYDDLKLEVETADDKWITLFSTSFEPTSKSKSPLSTFQTYPVNKRFKPTITTVDKVTGSHSLMMTGSGVPIYGINGKAGKYANVNGIRLYYEIYGQGTPLVVLHGNGGSISDATTYIEDLKKKYKVIAVDSRAQGRSGDTDAPLTYEQMASDVNALLEELKIDSALIWGHSDGAILGLILAMDHPAKVKKLVAFGSNIQPDSLALFPWVIKMVQKTLKESKDPKQKKLYHLIFAHPQIPYERLSSITVPVLVVSGDRDMIRPEHTLKIFQHIPKAHLFIIPGATHFAAWDKKDLFLKTMQNFFDEPFTMPDTKSYFEQ